MSMFIVSSWDKTKTSDWGRLYIEDSCIKLDFAPADNINIVAYFDDIVSGETETKGSVVLTSFSGSTDYSAKVSVIAEINPATGQYVYNSDGYAYSASHGGYFKPFLDEDSKNIIICVAVINFSYTSSNKSFGTPVVNLFNNYAILGETDKNGVTGNLSKRKWGTQGVGIAQERQIRKAEDKRIMNVVQEQAKFLSNKTYMVKDASYNESYALWHVEIEGVESISQLNGKIISINTKIYDIISRQGLKIKINSFDEKNVYKMIAATDTDYGHTAGNLSNMFLPNEIGMYQVLMLYCTESGYILINTPVPPKATYELSEKTTDDMSYLTPKLVMDYLKTVIKNIKGDWQLSEKYRTNDLVLHKGIIYTCIAENQNVEPSDINIPILNDGIYMFDNVCSGLRMEVQDGVSTTPANIQQWGSSGEDGWWQKFKLVCDNDGYYFIYTGASNYKNRVVINHEMNVAQYISGDGNSEKFTLEDLGNGKYKIISKGGYVISVLDSSTQAGGNIVAEEYSGKTSQQWKIVLDKELENKNKVSSRFWRAAFDLRRIAPSKFQEDITDSATDDISYVTAKKVREYITKNSDKIDGIYSDLQELIALNPLEYKQIADMQSVNNFKDAGLYSIYNNAQDLPERNDYGTLIVSEIMSASNYIPVYIHQIYFSLKSNKTYTRFFDNETQTWNDWDDFDLSKILSDIEFLNNTISQKADKVTNGGFIAGGAEAGEVGNISIGDGIASTGAYGVVIGSGAEGASNCVAIGRTTTAAADNAVAIGYGAESVADNAVQIGDGSNSDKDTMKFRGYKIVGCDFTDNEYYINDVGRLSRLYTTNQSSIVEAINELSMNKGNNASKAVLGEALSKSEEFNIWQNGNWIVGYNIPPITITDETYGSFTLPAQMLEAAGVKEKTGEEKNYCYASYTLDTDNLLGEISDSDVTVACTFKEAKGKPNSYLEIEDETKLAAINIYLGTIILNAEDDMTPDGTPSTIYSGSETTNTETSIDMLRIFNKPNIVSEELIEITAEEIDSMF